MFNFWVPPYFLDPSPQDQPDIHSDSDRTSSPVAPSEDDPLERFVSPILGANGCSDYAQDCLDDLLETQEDNPSQLDRKIVEMFDGTIKFLEFYVLNIATIFNHDQIAVRIIDLKSCPRILGRSPNLQSEDTPLHLAACFGNLAIINKLLASDASITAKNSRGLTPLEIAVLFERPQAIDILMKPLLKMPLQEIESHALKMGPLQVACYRNNAEVVRHFLDLGCNVCQKISLYPLFQDHMALHLAVEFSSKQVVLLLLKAGAVVDAQTARDRQTPLHLTTDFKKYFNNKNDELFADQLEIVKSLLAKEDCNINARMSDGSNSIFDFVDLCSDDPREFASYAARLKTDPRVWALLDLLLSSGIDVNASKVDGATILHDLASHGANWDVYEWKLARKLVRTGGARADRHDKDGETPLHFAICAKADPEVLTFLMTEAGADANCRDVEGMTPMHHAVICGSELVVLSRLVEFGANPNAKDSSGKTPMHLACEKGRQEVAKQLLAFGADLNIQDEAGLTAPSYGKFDFLVRHLIECQALDFEVCEENLNLLKDGKDDGYLEQCKIEVRRLKEKRIDKDTTFYDLFLKSANQLAHAIAKKKFKEFVDDLRKNGTVEFPIYGTWIERLYAKGADRKGELEKARLSFEGLAKVKLPNECLSEIFFYCSNRDLKTFNRAAEK